MLLRSRSARSDRLDQEAGSVAVSVLPDSDRSTREVSHLMVSGRVPLREA